MLDIASEALKLWSHLRKPLGLETLSLKACSFEALSLELQSLESLELQTLGLKPLSLGASLTGKALSFFSLTSLLFLFLFFGCLLDLFDFLDASGDLVLARVLVIEASLNDGLLDYRRCLPRDFLLLPHGVPEGAILDALGFTYEALLQGLDSMNPAQLVTLVVS